MSTHAVIELSDIRFMHRHVVGSTDPQHPMTQEQVNVQMDQLNELLKKGRLVNIEKSFIVITHGDAQVVMEYCAYHIGFKRKPVGL